jgi:transposase
MRTKVIYIGLDVHKDTIAVATARGREPAAVLEVIQNDWVTLIQILERIGSRERLRLCYEAGPTGYDLARRLNENGYCCQVVAPSLVPTRPGDRIKTDRRDAARLAQFLRSGDLVEVKIPEAQTEAMRDLERARDDAKKAERVARHQLDKFLLRHGRSWSQGTKWTKKHWSWIRAQQLPEEMLRRVLHDYVTTIEQATQRVERLDKDIVEMVEQWALKPLVLSLMALRGVQLTTAVILAAEIGDFARFKSPRHLMSYLGLVPSEHSSGQRRLQGRITRTGNGHVRRISVEAAWNYRFPPRASKAIQKRREQAPAEARAIAEKAEQRLSRRFQRLTQRGKKSQTVVTAVAREFVGFVWAIAQIAMLPAT